MEPTPALNGKTCIHYALHKNGAVRCDKPALQTKSVNHGWLCEKHYWLTKTKPNMGRGER